jgi:hypothetical protein
LISGGSPPAAPGSPTAHRPRVQRKRAAPPMASSPAETRGSLC